MTAPRRTADETPGTLVGAVARGGALLLRDWLLNTGVLLSLVVGVGGVLSGRQPWTWLGPVLGVIGLVVSFAGHRERAVATATGEDRRTLLPAPAIWAAAIGVPVIDVAVMWLMWS